MFTNILFLILIFKDWFSIARFISITLILKIWYTHIIYIINHTRKLSHHMSPHTICSLHCLISISSLHIGLQIVEMANHFSLTMFNVLNSIHSAIHYHFLNYSRTCPRMIKLHTSSTPCSVVIVKNVVTHLITIMSSILVISALLNLTCFPQGSVEQLQRHHSFYSSTSYRILCYSTFESSWVVPVSKSIGSLISLTCCRKYGLDLALSCTVEL